MGKRIFKVFAIIVYLTTFILLALTILSDGNILIDRKTAGFISEPELKLKNFLTLIFYT